MAAKIIDGKEIAGGILSAIGKRVQKMGQKPGLAVIRVGEYAPSVIYVNRKEKACKEAGFYSEKHVFGDDLGEGALIRKIQELNHDAKIHGILAQLPLPRHINPDKVLEAIDIQKDVDGFHPYNQGKLFSGQPVFVPATPKGILRLIESTGVPIAGRHAVVVGRSATVGRPIALLLLAKDATVTMAHSKTKSLKQLTREADILVVAVGKPNFIKHDFVKKGAVVIDVGINRRRPAAGKKYRIVGDVDFEDVKKTAGHITPVPGGVGPMTIAMLLENTLLAKEIQERN